MDPILDVTILGEPVGQGRPRAVRMGNLGVRLHAAPKSADWQAIAAQQFAAAWQRPSHADAVRMVVGAVGPRPKNIVKRMGSGRYWCERKPDLDNVVKAVGDALVTAGVLVDDTLVAQIAASKVVAADGEGPHVRVRLFVLPPIDVVPWPVAERKTTKPRKPAASGVLI